MDGINKKIRKFNMLHFFIFLVTITIVIIVIYNSYSKYITSINGNAAIGIARWKIYVNNQDINGNNNLSNVITPVFPGNNNVASGVIAPTAEGYFDMVIDASDTDVSFSYIITTSNNPDSAVSDLVISGYEIDGGERQSVSGASGVQIQNTIAYDSLDKTVNLRVYLKWNDDSENGATMNNAADTSVTATETNTAKVNVNLRFIQLPSNSGTTTTTTGDIASTTGGDTTTTG